MFDLESKSLRRSVCDVLLKVRRWNSEIRMFRLFQKKLCFLAASGIVSLRLLCLTWDSLIFFRWIYVVVRLTAKDLQAEQLKVLLGSTIASICAFQREKRCIFGLKCTERL